MKIKKFLIVFLICIFTFAEVPQAVPGSGPIKFTTTYKQGIYDASQYSGYIATARLITPNKCLGGLIIDSNYNVKFYKKFDNTDEETSLGIINKGDIAVVVGTGEAVVSHKEKTAMPTFVKTQQEEQPLVPPVSGTIKQGIYDISKFTGYTVTAKLATPNTVAFLIRIDSNCNLKYVVKLNNVNETIKLGSIEKGDTAILVGNGELSVSYSR